MIDTAGLNAVTAREYITGKTNGGRWGLLDAAGRGDGLDRRLLQETKVVPVGNPTQMIERVDDSKSARNGFCQKCRGPGGLRG